MIIVSCTVKPERVDQVVDALSSIEGVAGVDVVFSDATLLHPQKSAHLAASCALGGHSECLYVFETHYCSCDCHLSRAGV